MKNKIDIKKYQDKTIPLNERRIDFSNRVNKHLNPIPEENFDPETFEPAGEDMRLVGNRQRIDLPNRLPTYGIKPKQIREGQMIGMYESKQDLYLISAQIYNKLQDKIEELESTITDLQNQINNK